MLWYRKATYKDVLSIAPCLREADRNECEAATGQSPEAVLRQTWKFRSGPIHTILKDTTPVGLVGVDEILQHPIGIVRVPWMCGTDLMVSSGVEFLRGFKECFFQVFNLDAPLANWIDSRNTVHLKWLEWMGFTIHRHMPREIRGVTFYPFEYNTCATPLPSSSVA